MTKAELINEIRRARDLVKVNDYEGAARALKTSLAAVELAELKRRDKSIDKTKNVRVKVVPGTNGKLYRLYIGGLPRYNNIPVDEAKVVAKLLVDRGYNLVEAPWLS